MKNKFMFATGIENSYPTVFINGKKVRVDELEKTGHYKRWQEDFGLVKDLGIEYLRYGPPYFSTHIGPGKYDWTFADDTFNALKELHITPIVDLCHFGVPDWLDNFQNPDFPQYFAEYALAFAKRYPHLKFYTPVNEIFVTASFSGQYGWWNESLSSDRGFVTALKHLCKANVLAMEAIERVQPDVTFIQSESSEYFHPEDPSCCALADFLNLKRFLSLDLSYAHSIKVPHYKYLMENGMTDAEYEWFMNNKIRGKCIMGTDYYVSNEHIVHSDGSTSPSGEIFGYYVITHQYYTRYRLPVMHTETNIAEPASVAWLQKEWANLYRFMQDGFPIVGFTWYSLLDQVDWETALRQDNGNVNPLGLYDLNRKIRPVGEAYQNIIKNWRPVLDNESLNVNFNT
ncbi:family 1 glycosylhydrolase [uncultured Mucilaginibacter sp.]|uniref:family 1 glycosylhydrolase n=1 Tax=uncultured Mucilaginibacter sp. TaxID=797541 RepID=UPI00262FA112|nr:family 1 glycosylhydrolase [uncultured Mucilaginibacter sp.]